MQGLHLYSKRIYSWLEENEEAILGARDNINSWAISVMKFLRNTQLDDIIMQSGWLPHYTLPESVYQGLWQALDDPTNASEEELKQISNSMLSFYQEHWVDARSTIQASIQLNAPDKESLEVVVEALNAHEQGLYRCVCSVLFPTIERAMRITASPDSQDHVQYWGNNKIKDFVGRVRSGYPGRWFDVVYNSLKESPSSGIYGRMQEDKDLLHYENTFVPNRHAVAHAYRSYDQCEHSLNMIFLVDFMFHFISFYDHSDGSKSEN